MEFRKRQKDIVRAASFAVEQLEGRRLYSTTTAFSGADYGTFGSSTAAGVSASFSVTPSTAEYASQGEGGYFGYTGDTEAADSASVTLTNLPAHTMVRVTMDTEIEFGSGHDDPASTSTLTVTAGNSFQSATVPADSDS